MAGISALPRDLRRVRTELQRWLAEQWPDCARIEVGDFRTSSDGGFSSESLMFDVDVVGATGERSVRSLVARLPPQGEGLFREYDLRLQHHVQNVLAEVGVPVAGQVGYCDDEDRIGSPFLVMDYVPGRVPSNQPMYNVAGWLKDIPADQQAFGYQNVLAAMAQVHCVDTARVDRSVLSRSTGNGLVAEFDWYLDYVLWATDGEPPPEVARVIDWCRQRMPVVSHPDSICWGDARLGNVMFGDGMTVAALLDWEMATLCPPELDVGWFLAFRKQIRARTGETAASELAGFPDHDASVRAYEKALGRPLVDLEWFEVFAMLRLAGMALATKRLVTRLGITDHFIFGFAPVEQWVLDIVDR